MNRSRSLWVVAIVVGTTIGMMGLGCSTGGSSKMSSTGTSGIQVVFTAPAGSATIDQGQSISFAVSVANDPKNQGVTWSLQTAIGKPPGNLTNQNATGATYVAPASVTNSTSLSVVATSVTDPSVSAIFSLIVAPLPQITSNSPTPGGCPAPGTVITGLGSSYGTVWTVGVPGLTYYLQATGGAAPYTWSITSGTLPAGLLMGAPTSSQTVIYGSPTTPGCSNITLQATDAAGASVTAQYYIVVLPPGLIIQQPPLAVPEVGVAYPPTALAAANGIGPYVWNLNANDPLPPGLSLGASPENSAAAIISGTPTADGIGQGFSPNVLVYDSETPYPATAQPNIAITQVVQPDTTCHTGAESGLSTSGPYAFLLRGFDANGPVVIGGNFTVDGAGSITGGVEDVNRTAGAQTSLSILAGSSYTLGSDNHGCITLTNSAGTTTTFRFAVGGCSTSASLQGGCQSNGYFTSGRILEDDSASSTRATGILRLTDPSAFSNSGLSGLYAFGLRGWDYQGGRYALAGSGNAASGNFSSIAADINDAGALSSSLTGGTGSYTLGSNGRGTATFTVGSVTLDAAVYLVSNTEAIFLTTGTLGQDHPMLSGEALSATGPFKGSSLQNSYLLQTAGVSLGAADPNIGVLSFTSSASSSITVSGTIYENDGGTPTTTAVSGYYTVDSVTGRLSLTAQSSQNVGPHPLVGYVVSAASGVGAFLVSTDASAQAGELYFQNANPPVTNFSDVSLEGPQYLGTDEDLDANAGNYVGAVSPNGSGQNAGCLCDVSIPGAGLTPNERFIATYSVSKNGTGVFGGETVSVTNGTTTYYIDESPLDTHPAVTVVQK